MSLSFVLLGYKKKTRYDDNLHISLVSTNGIGTRLLLLYEDQPCSMLYHYLTLLLYINKYRCAKRKVDLRPPLFHINAW